MYVLREARASAAGRLDSRLRERQNPACRSRKGLPMIFKKRVSRWLLATATAVTAATAAAVVSIPASGASAASAPALPGLGAPGLHVRAATAAPGPADACGYQAAIPA